jgi:glutaconate CoA-transferase subunit A
MAAERRYVSCERVIDTADFVKEGPVQTLRVNRAMTDAVVETPNGAHFTSCVPDYGRDEAFQKVYADSARDPDAWAAFHARYLDGTEDDYQREVRAG